MADLDKRVTKTEKDVSKVKATVKQQGTQLRNVKGKMAAQGQQMDKVKDKVDKTAAKAEEMDQKVKHILLNHLGHFFQYCMVIKFSRYYIY